MYYRKKVAKRGGGEKGVAITFWKKQGVAKMGVAVTFLKFGGWRKKSWRKKKNQCHNHTSSAQEHANVRSAVICACCWPRVSLKSMSELLEIYENRNLYKLNKYKERKVGYMNCTESHMSRHRYAADHYGFPNKVVIFEGLIRWRWVRRQIGRGERCSI